ncbi:hypothetical protein BS17DRAFT_879930, partial [Gyrodon lividus]
MPRPTTRSHPIAQDSSPLPDDTDLFNLAADTSADFEGLSFPGALHSPHSPSRPGADAQDVAPPSADRTPIEEAAALAENVPGVFLQPPSEEEASTHELLTPQTGRCTCAHSGDSPSGQSDFPKKNKGKKKAADQSAPSPEVTVASPSPRLLLWLPPCQSDGVPPLVSVLECLASRGTPANANVPPQSAHDIYHHTIFAQASKGLDLNVPYVVSHLQKVLAEVIPDVDFSDLLEAPILNLPDPNACLLLPGFQLATNSSSVVRLVPVQPEVLDGHKLALPARVVNVMKANWNVHIPLTALSTRSLTSLTLSAHEESGQALSVKDGVISLSSSCLSAKDEGSLTSQEWLHAFPHLIECIRHFLPSPARSEIADLWQQHYNTIALCPDLWDLFHIYLCYDICLRVHFVDPSNSLNPSIWQEVVWRQTIDAYCT